MVTSQSPDKTLIEGCRPDCPLLDSCRIQGFKRCPMRLKTASISSPLIYSLLMHAVAVCLILMLPIYGGGPVPLSFRGYPVFLTGGDRPVQAHKGADTENPVAAGRTGQRRRTAAKKAAEPQAKAETKKEKEAPEKVPSPGADSKPVPAAEAASQGTPEPVREKAVDVKKEAKTEREAVNKPPDVQRPEAAGKGDVPAAQTAAVSVPGSAGPVSLPQVAEEIVPDTEALLKYHAADAEETSLSVKEVPAPASSPESVAVEPTPQNLSSMLEEILPDTNALLQYQGTAKAAKPPVVKEAKAVVSAPAVKHVAEKPAPREVFSPLEKILPDTKALLQYHGMAKSAKLPVVKKAQPPASAPAGGNVAVKASPKKLSSPKAANLRDAKGAKPPASAPAVKHVAANTSSQVPSSPIEKILPDMNSLLRYQESAKAEKLPESEEAEGPAQGKAGGTAEGVTEEPGRSGAAAPASGQEEGASASPGVAPGTQAPGGQAMSSAQVGQQKPGDMYATGKQQADNEKRSVPVGIEGAAALLTRDIKISVTVAGEDGTSVSTQLFRRKYPSADLDDEIAKQFPVKAAEEDGHPEDGQLKRVFSVVKADKGIYTFVIGNAGRKSCTADVAFLLFEGTTRERTKQYKGVRLLPGTGAKFRFLVPDAIFWDDEDRFTGSTEDSDWITKFNSDTGLVWRERKDQ